MVQALIDLINNESYEETSVKEVFSCFHCSKDADVDHFLKDCAIQHEKQKLARTYLILDDDELKKGNIKLNGYFTIAIKSLKFSETISNTTKKDMAKSKTCTHVAGYLLAQLAKDDTMDKGYGKIILDTAVAYIKNAQKCVGGRFVYIDCKDCLIDYYKKNSFKYIQKNQDDNTLNQMYIIL